MLLTHDSMIPASKKGEWEILEGLKEGQRFDLVPRKFEGFLLKRRKWPLKGWHKVGKKYIVHSSVWCFNSPIAMNVCSETVREVSNTVLDYQSILHMLNDQYKK